MKLNRQKTLFSNNTLFTLKNDEWVSKQRVAGKICADTLTMLQNCVKDGTTKSLRELDAIADEYIVSQKATPTFKGYKGFPNAVCISVNKQLVHGIPTDYVLKDGDVVKFDLGATVDGVIADTAITCIFGTPKSERHVQLLKVTEKALMDSIAEVKVGRNIGVIGDTIYKSGKGAGFGVIVAYGGHGIGFNKPHDAPFISNKADSSDGVRIQAGMTIAIEPLFVLSNSTRTNNADDGWTVLADDICSHFEHTIYVHEDRVEVMTARG